MAREPAIRTEHADLETFTRYIRDRAELDSDGIGADISQQQLRNVLTATSEDELFAALEIKGLTPLKSLATGTEIQINGYHLVRGTRDDYANSLGVFAVIDAQTIADGTELTLDTGIERIIGFLRMVESGQAGIDFPVSVVIHKIVTGSGNEMVTFRRLPKRSIPGIVSLSR